MKFTNIFIFTFYAAGAVAVFSDANTCVTFNLELVEELTNGRALLVQGRLRLEEIFWQYLFQAILVLFSRKTFLAENGKFCDTPLTLCSRR